MTQEKAEKKQDFWGWLALLSVGSHVFCCVLPTVLSAVAIASGIGVLATLPGWLETVHEAVHDYEWAILAFSGTMVAIGWAAHYYSIKNDCHSHGCEHGSCQPTKRRASRLLMIASALFLVNIAVYVTFHEDPHAPEHHAHEHHDHAHEEHDERDHIEHIHPQ